MRHLMPLSTFKLHPDAEGVDRNSDVTHATIAHEMLEQAKGGHAVMLVSNDHAPVTAHPGDDFGDLTARVGDAMAGQEPEVMEDAMDDAPLNPDGTPMSKRQRAAAKKAAEKMVGNQ